MTSLRLVNKWNPFLPTTRLLSNNTIYYASNDVCAIKHIKDIIDQSRANKRYLHINTATHGTESGSSLWWMSKETTESLNNKKDRKKYRKLNKEWREGASKFLNEDFTNLLKMKHEDEDHTYFSMTIVSENTFPEYPENCDILDAWCFSADSPRCSRDIVYMLKNF